jgi:Xaa-Pro aminopeptidase
MARIPSEVVFGGSTESQIARRLREMTVEEGHDRAEFAIVGSGPNSASPHHEADSRIVTEGDMIVCDFGGRWGGYYSDSTRTFVVGQPTPKQAEVHSVVLAANEAGRQAVRPGVSCEEIDSAVRMLIADAGYGDEFIHRTGHGIGLEVHEEPYIVEGNGLSLEPGMAFSIEPGIYLRDEFGVRVEDVVVCSDNGVESLNESDRSQVVVG